MTEENKISAYNKLNQIQSDIFELREGANRGFDVGYRYENGRIAGFHLLFNNTTSKFSQRVIDYFTITLNLTEIMIDDFIDDNSIYNFYKEYIIELNDDFQIEIETCFQIHINQWILTVNIAKLE